MNSRERRNGNEMNIKRHLKNSRIRLQVNIHASKKKEKFRVETDASEHTIEGVLFQEQERKWKPIVFLSRTM